jgi:hypothetical protein
MDVRPDFRKDPFPPVTLQAASAGMLLGCSHGTAGLVSPYLDLTDMIDSLEELLDREDEQQRMGQVAAGGRGAGSARNTRSIKPARCWWT